MSLTQAQGREGHQGPHALLVTTKNEGVTVYAFLDNRSVTYNIGVCPLHATCCLPSLADTHALEDVVLTM